MSEHPSDTHSVPGETEIRSRFGFELPDDRWLDRVRAFVAPKSGLTIGPYELIGEMRRGAQGVVVRARQPNTQRVIALKRLAHGNWSTAEERFRFAREVEAAVALNHPNVVTVYGLEFIDEQPLLAMEWIDGEPIDRWARHGATADRRSQSEILRVFLKVCSAIQHAHQRGVIHRDLKPANILIDSNGEPKVLDFGLAKRFDRASSAERLTASGDFLGSPAYAAPEQLKGNPDAVDVRTDVYALGIILYELLTGALPFAPTGGIVELFDAITCGQVSPPSRLDSSIDNDLDAIVLKAIALEPERRYSSVDALSGDFRRYQAHEPVEARRGQRGYALRKLVRRNWMVLTTLGGFVAIIVTAAAALSIMYAQERRMLLDTSAARDAEKAARRNSERVQALLEQLLLRVAEAGRGTDVALRRQLLSQAEAMIQGDLSDAPEAQARAYDAIGRTYQRLALYDEAERCLRASVDLNLAVFGSDSLEDAASSTHLADLLQDRSRYADAEVLFRRALEIRTRLLVGDHPAIAESLHNLGNVLSNQGDYRGALAMFENAYERRRRLLGDRHAASIASLTAIGLAHANLDEFEAAEVRFREAVSLSEEVLGPDNRETAGRYVGLGKILQSRGNLDEAEQYLRKGLTGFRALFGNRHDNVAWAAHRLGVLLHARGRLQEAEALLREARATYREVLGPDDPFVGYVDESLTALLRETGCDDESREFSTEALSIRSKTAARKN